MVVACLFNAGPLGGIFNGVEDNPGKYFGNFLNPLSLG